MELHPQPELTDTPNPTRSYFVAGPKRLMYRITREGKVASMRAGRELRFWQSDLDAYLERRRKPPLDAA